MRKRNRFDEPREVAHVAHQRLGLHLLFEINADVGGQRFPTFFRAVNNRYQTIRQRRVQIERIPQLSRHERMQRQDGRPSGQQVHPRAPQLSGAGAGHDKLDTGLLLHDLVHNIQQGRNALHFVDDHPGGTPLRGQPLPQTLGTRHIRAVGLGIEQIQRRNISEHLPQPRRFPRAARPEKERAAPGLL